MTANVKGKSVADAEQLVAEFRDGHRQLAAVQPNHLGRRCSRASAPACA